MQGRILFVTGAAVGYVLGARAGRRRYEQIKGGAERIWNNPKVQDSVDQVVDQVQGFVKDKAPEVKDAVTGQAKKVAGQIRRKADSAGSNG